MIALSLNEVETLAMKVGRGAGFSWGLAEDIGQADDFPAGQFVRYQQIVRHASFEGLLSIGATYVD